MKIPKKYFQPFIDNIFAATALSNGNAVDYKVVEGNIYVLCTDLQSFKPISFFVDNYWVKVDARDYIWDSTGSNTACTLLVRENELDFFVLGLPLFQGYYMTHNMTDSAITFAPMANSSKNEL